MSLAHLATIGTLKYNGYTFDGGSRVKVNVEFVKDDAGRTVIYSKHTIEVTGFVADASSTDGQLETIREKLSHQGQELIFKNKGFGDDLVVNSPGGALRDVKWGPVPEVLYWEPVGSAAACEFSWRVVTCVPICENSAARTSGVMAFNFEVDFAIDYRGLTTRTITGYIEIAQTRSAKNVPDSADAYRFLVQPECPLGFQRDQDDWHLSSDKSRIDFNIADRQLPTRNPYPNLVTKIDAKQSTRWAPYEAGGSAYQRGTISLDIELTLDTQPTLGWNLFGGLVRSRLAVAQRNGFSLLFDELRVEEDIFGLGSSFELSFRLLKTIGQANGSTGGPADANPQIPPDWFDPTAAGLWQPIGTDWRLWRTSMSGVLYNRGFAGLTQAANTDVIVDLCGAGVTIPWTGTAPGSSPKIGPPAPAIRNKRPSPTQSFITYKQRVAIRRQRYLARQRPLQPTPGDGVSGNMFDPTGVRFSDNASSSASGGSSVTPDTIQTGGAPSYEILYIGNAQRAGYEIPRPSVQSVGGQTPVESDAMWMLDQVGTAFGVPIFQAMWAIKYLLPAAPSSVSGPPNLQG